MSLLPAAVLVTAAAYTLILFLRFGRRAIFILAGTLLAAVGVAAAALATGWVYCLLHPVCKVVYLEPDKALGWKGMPGLEFTSTGLYGEFSVPVRINREGFHDLDRPREKPPGTIRVALLGDSLVEAVQVPFTQTAAQVLESWLNASAGDGRRFEVLNFGIGNYGIGQCLLAYEGYARYYRPDYVFLLSAWWLWDRTVWPTFLGPNDNEKMQSVWLRPVFGFRNGRLEADQPPHYGTAVTIQQEYLVKEFGGGHQRLKQPWDYLPELWDRIRGHSWKYPAGPTDTSVRVNKEIIRELGKGVKRDGGRFYFLDFDNYAPEVVFDMIALCREEGFQYIPFGRIWGARIDKDRPARWPKDGHLNAYGNRVFAAVIYQAVSGRQPPSPP